MGTPDPDGGGVVLISRQVVRAVAVGVTLTVLLAGTGLPGGIGAAAGPGEAAVGPTGGEPVAGLDGTTAVEPATGGTDAVDRPAAADGNATNETDDENWFDDRNATDYGNATEYETLTDFSVASAVGALPGSGSSPTATSAVAAASSVGSCTDVTSSGVYTLGADLAGDDPVCMNVTASDVVVDGQGHTIDASGGMGVLVANGETGLRNVTVRNLTVRNGTVGVQFGAPGVPVENATLRSAAVLGNADGGVRIAAGRNVTVVDSRLADNDQFGLELDGADRFRLEVDGFYGTVSNVTVLDTVVNGNDGFGISVMNADDTVIENVDVSDNFGNVFAARSDGLVLRGVTARNAGFDGVVILDSPDAVLRNVDAAGNGGNGVTIRSSDDVAVTDGRFTDNRIGIQSLASEGLQLVDVAVLDNAEWAIRLDSFSREIVGPLEHGSELTGSTATGTDVDVGSATIGFGESRDFAVRAAPAPPDPPQGLVGVDQYVFATNTSPDGSLAVRFNYADGDARGVVESTLGVYRHDGSRWFGVENGRADAGADRVAASVDSFSVLAPFGQALGGGRGSGERVAQGDAVDGEQYACDHMSGEDGRERPEDCDA